MKKTFPNWDRSAVWQEQTIFLHRCAGADIIRPMQKETSSADAGADIIRPKPRRADGIRPYGLDAVFRPAEQAPEFSVFQMKTAWNPRRSSGISRPFFAFLLTGICFPI
jgi:hypothetical protein